MATEDSEIGDWRMRAFMATTPGGRAIAEAELRKRGAVPPTAEEYEAAEDDVREVRSWGDW